MYHLATCTLPQVHHLSCQWIESSMQPFVHSSDKHQVEHLLDMLSRTPKQIKNCELFTATDIGNLLQYIKY